MTSNGTFIDRSRARVPAVLRYRGMEAEALMATHLINVESLVASIQLVLDDLRPTLGKRPDFPDITIEGALRSYVHQADDHRHESFPLGHVLLVESILETALSHVREATQAARTRFRQQAWEGGGRVAPDDASTAFDAHRKPWSMNDVRGRDCCASHVENGTGG